VRGAGQRNACMPPEMAGDPLVRDAHRVEQCPARPERRWMQHHNGIFRSDNGGGNWQELRDVPPSSLGFAVAVRPRETDIAWFVPWSEGRCLRLIERFTPPGRD